MCLLQLAFNTYKAIYFGTHLSRLKFFHIDLHTLFEEDIYLASEHDRTTLALDCQKTAAQ